MGKKTKALSGASQDAYFRRVLKTQANLSADERDRVVRFLRQEIAQLRLRRQAKTDVDALAPDAEPAAKAAPASEPVSQRKPAPRPLVVVDLPPPAPAVAFDPYTPNVIVVLRKSGRDAALAALGSIDSVDNLRLLAREQRLSIPEDAGSAKDLRSQIVAAAERRVANRMAAAT